MVTGHHALSLDEFLDSVDAPIGACKTAVRGPRTHGCYDAGWEADLALFTNCKEHERANLTWTGASELIAVIASSWDPTIAAATECERDARVTAWFTGPLKAEYKTVRVVGKRPWPEFAAALRTGCGLSTADVSAVYAITRTTVCSVDARGALVIPHCLRKVPLETEVLDARTAKPCQLFEVVLDALQASVGKKSMAARADALALDASRCPRNVLASRIAAREAELASVRG